MKIVRFVLESCTFRFRDYKNAVIYYFAAIQGVREALKEAPEFLMNGSEQPLLLATFERFGEGAKLRTENVDS